MVVGVEFCYSREIEPEMMLLSVMNLYAVSPLGVLAACYLLYFMIFYTVCSAFLLFLGVEDIGLFCMPGFLTLLFK